MLLAFVDNSCGGLVVLVLVSADNCEIGFGPRCSVGDGLVRYLVPIHILELLMSDLETRDHFLLLLQSNQILLHHQHLERG